MTGKIGVEIARIVRDLCAQPVGFVKRLRFAVQLYLCHHQACVVAGKVVDLPKGALVHQHMPSFLYWRVFAWMKCLPQSCPSTPSCSGLLWSGQIGSGYSRFGPQVAERAAKI